MDEKNLFNDFNLRRPTSFVLSWKNIKSESSKDFLGTVAK